MFADWSGTVLHLAAAQQAARSGGQNAVAVACQCGAMRLRPHLREQPRGSTPAPPPARLRQASGAPARGATAPLRHGPQELITAGCVPLLVPTRTQPRTSTVHVKSKVERVLEIQQDGFLKRQQDSLGPGCPRPGRGPWLFRAAAPGPRPELGENSPASHSRRGKGLQNFLPAGAFRQKGVQHARERREMVPTVHRRTDVGGAWVKQTGCHSHGRAEQRQARRGEAGQRAGQRRQRTAAARGHP